MKTIAHEVRKRKQSPLLPAEPCTVDEAIAESVKVMLESWKQQVRAYRASITPVWSSADYRKP